MGARVGIGEKFRRHRLLVPIAGLTFGGLLLLVLLTIFLIHRFDRTALQREQHMVEQGFHRQIEQYEEVIVPQADWDKAIARLDHEFDADFADVNFGSQLYTFNGFSRTFFVDGDGKVIYAAVDGKQADKKAFRPFIDVVTALLVPIRNAETLRPPIRPDPASNHPVTQPIQANGMVRVEGRVYIVIATLIQPDLGLVLPKGPRAPVVITAMPIDGTVLGTFAARYLVDDLELVNSSAHAGNQASLSLRSPTGREIGALAWTPRQPGSALYHQLRLPLFGALLVFGAVGWLIVRRSRVIVDEVIASERQAKHLAYHDQLTRVPNRTMLFNRMPAMLAGIGRDFPLLAVLCVDLDRFKEVNDTLGHHAGDDLLKTLAERLHAASMSASDALIARLGGDEFVLLCPVLDRRAAEELAECCLSLIMQPMDCPYGRIDVGCSIGVAVIDSNEADPSQVLRRADLALYESKTQGRGRATFFEPGMDEAFRARRAIEENLRTALRNGALRLVYQPQVDIAGEAWGVEALLRWSHPNLGEISPEVFIPIAEESGLIMAIGEFVLGRVFEETGSWRHLRVAINVSAIQMRTPGYAAQVIQFAAKAGIDPTRYEIELTETALLGDGPATAENVDLLRRVGFSIVLDDFGTGYSSLSLLHRFQVDKIKIDRSFISSLDEAEEVEGLVSAIVKLAKSFRLGVIAEGVETEEQRQQLILAGCTEFQGFLTGRPMPAPDIEELFEMPAIQRRLA
ncbi:diguanylate cyclase [Novosphingobium endophyticum]|uniref:Diguanylate cyclase n=1 Tax=Novosphingobium endophyticum TaxID=1955250 RepID=A0A916TUL2_9SPHN|nr:EAL domain-containing protein [Novosphingobium endophyticum]GGC07855.1 diguanylate cyclase [Novosphingobium endophyticum]